MKTVLKRGRAQGHAVLPPLRAPGDSVMSPLHPPPRVHPRARGQCNVGACKYSYTGYVM